LVEPISGLICIFNEQGKGSMKKTITYGVAVALALSFGAGGIHPQKRAKTARSRAITTTRRRSRRPFKESNR
jgi:hypothetical protein